MTPIGYIASHYPAVSHTFVMREVDALRARGVHVETLSIHRADESELLTADDRAAADSTFAVLPASARRLLRVHAAALARRPLRYLATFTAAVRSSRPGLRARLWQLFYFAETILVARHCLDRGIRHLHAQFADSASDVAMLATRYIGDDSSWSIAVHGPVEFRDAATNGLATKVGDASFVQTISHFGRSQVLALLDESDWGKVHVVRCGIDPGTLRPAEPRKPDGRFAVLCVGRLVPWKGQALLLAAVAELVDRGIDATLELIGDGPSRGELERRAAELGVEARVTFRGAVGQDRIRACYEACDVFCLPSFAEGVPVVLMEAMAIARPVVSTRIMGIPELVEDGVSGRLVAPGDLDELVEALAGIASMSDPGALGARGRERVIAEYDVTRSAADLERLFSAGNGPATLKARD